MTAALSLIRRRAARLQTVIWARNLIARLLFVIYTSDALWAELVMDTRGAAGDIKTAYAASAALTQTALDGVSSSSTWVAGWTSDYIDNSTNLYEDYIVNVQVQVESTGISAGEIRVYYYRELDDSTNMTLFSSGTPGSQGAVTIHDTEVRDAAFLQAGVAITDTTVSRLYPIVCRSPREVFGVMPRKWAIFITQSSGNTLETTGDPNVVIIKGVYQTVAQS